MEIILDRPTKPVIANAWYHVYNRGAHHADVFRSDKDFWAWRRISRYYIRAYKKFIKINVFSILPNHYHFELFQTEPKIISELMKRIAQKYAYYFNRKYSLSGRIFQNEYQAIYLPNSEDVKRVENYILNNPLDAGYMNWQHVGRKL
jgi:putative transposase